jgi:beta-hydroxylase
MFYDPGLFAFTPILEQNWQRIYDEYLGVQKQLFDWTEKELYGDGTWKVLLLYTMPDGKPIDEVVRKCPFTASLVKEHIPRHGVVTFSVLHSQTRLQPHHGYPGWEFLRAHLALKVPAGDCALKVGGEVRRWQTGRVLVFDDQAMHEAWNLTDEPRVVLLVDFLSDKRQPLPRQPQGPT